MTATNRGLDVEAALDVVSSQNGRGFWIETRGKDLQAAAECLSAALRSSREELDRMRGAAKMALALLEDFRDANCDHIETECTCPATPIIDALFSALTNPGGVG